MDAGQAQHINKQKSKRRRRRDNGSGGVRLKNGAWHLQYRNGDGKVKSTVLVRRDDVYFSSTCDAVKKLAVEKLAKLQPNGNSKPDIEVADFWNAIYLPWAKEINPLVGEPNLRASTLSGYEQIWNQHLKARFAEKSLQQWTTVDGSNLLTQLAKTQGRNTLHHIRSLASGIFRHAVSTGYLNENPWKNASARMKTKAPAKTRHYTLKECLAILSALDEHTDCRLVMALAFFAGLRPGEIRGLRVEDFTSEASDKCPVCQEEDWDISVAHFHVRRSIDKNGNTTALKTPESEGPLPLMVPIALALQQHLVACGNPTSGWLFKTKNDTPADLRDWVRMKIRPALTTHSIEWKTLYAGRRGAATLLLQLSGNAVASQQLLRHRPGSAVTAKHYLKAIPEALLRGTKLVEQAVLKAIEEGNREDKNG
jgi:integrase